MAKYLKKYNEITKEWEIVSAPDVSLIQVLSGDTDITDTNVVVTNYNYAKDDGSETSLDETLTTISDDISKLQRNISWLAEHGGGGSGSGGGGSSYGIVVSKPVISEGAAYLSGDELLVEFTITGGTDGDPCRYSYEFDSEPATTYTRINVNEIVTIKIDLSKKPSQAFHSLRIRAKNPSEVNIAPVSFNIYVSTLSVKFDAATAGDDYQNEVYNIRKKE